jgi:protein TonB
MLATHADDAALMSFPMQPGGEYPGTPAASSQRLRWRQLVVFLAASSALHALLLVVAPSLMRERPLAQESALEVVLLAPEPPPVAPPAPLVPAAPQAGRKRALEQAGKAPPPDSHRPVESTAPPLALPDPRAPTAADFSVPPPASAEAHVPPMEAKHAAAAAAVVPPAFNAAYLRNPPPRYPLLARRAGEQGTVTLKVLVTRDGLPARVDVEKTSGSVHLDSAALDAVRSWRFLPARQGAEPIEAWVLVPIAFRLEGSS